MKHMSMKQLRIILLLLLFLHSKIGVALNVHYCGEHIAQISWAFDAKGCGMEKGEPFSPLKHQFIQQSCCSDDVIIAQNDSDQTTYESKFFQTPDQRIIANSAGIVPIYFPQKIIFYRGSAPPKVTALYKKNGAFIFYE